MVSETSEISITHKTRGQPRERRRRPQKSEKFNHVHLSTGDVLICGRLTAQYDRVSQITVEKSKFKIHKAAIYTVNSKAIFITSCFFCTVGKNLEHEPQDSERFCLSEGVRSPHIQADL